MSRVGKILIAHPNLPPANPFQRSVVWIYEDHDRGTVGLCLNKPSGITLEQFGEDNKLPGFEGNLNQIYLGGPVNDKAMVILHSNEWQSKNTAHITHDLAISSDDFMLEKIGGGNAPVYWRMFFGMSGWAFGQLDMEMSGQPPYKPENSWLTATANDNILFNYSGDKQWKKALQVCSQQSVERML